ncbi:MAG: VWA domain-containing protein [Deltaproteobacteria bacterium]|nr:VWA domain-containing protein [Deltaproteobacteria bacterium]
MISVSCQYTFRGATLYLVIAFLVSNCSAENSPQGILETTSGSGASAGVGGGDTNSGGALYTAGTTSDNGTAVTDSAGSQSQSNEICADQEVQVSRIIPWILFVIDRSGSMSESYTGSTSRWQAVYDALMAENEGVIARLQRTVEFGIMLFDGEGTCPRLVTVDPAINNYDPIDAVYSTSSPGRITPTAMALNAAYAIVPDQQTQLDTQFKPHYVILCTDGEPNGCPEATGFFGESGIVTDFQGPINEVTAAAARDIKTFVVSVASGGQEYQDFLDQLAQIGNTGSPAFSPTTKEDLVGRLTEIVGGAIGCEVVLNGKVTVGSECAGTVELNGVKLGCNDPNGWRLVDPNHIELLGQACESFMGNPDVVLSASFPCDVVVIE